MVIMTPFSLSSQLNCPAQWESKVGHRALAATRVLQLFVLAHSAKLPNTVVVVVHTEEELTILVVYKSLSICSQGTQRE